MTLSSSYNFWHMPKNFGFSQLSSSAIFISALIPYSNFLMSLKQSSIVSTDMLIKVILGTGLDMVISLSSSSDIEQFDGLQGAASMYWSSEIPSLQRKLSSIGSKGLRSVGMKQLSLALSTAAALYIDIISLMCVNMCIYFVIAVSTLGRKKGGTMCLKSHTGNVCAVVVIVFIALPRGIIGLLQLEWEGSNDDLWLIDVPGTVTSGSLNSTAVAGIVLGTTNPESAPNPVLNTDITTAPGNPAAKSDTSAPTAAFYINIA